MALNINNVCVESIKELFLLLAVPEWQIGTQKGTLFVSVNIGRDDCVKEGNIEILCFDKELRNEMGFIDIIKGYGIMWGTRVTNGESTKNPPHICELPA